MPFMGKIAVPKGKGFPPSVQDCGAGEIYAYLVAALILGQHFIDSNGDKLPIPVPEPEPYGRDFSVCVRAGDHLHRDIHT